MGIYIHSLSLPPKGEAYLVDPDGVVYRYIPTDDGEDHIVRKIDAKPVEVPPHGRFCVYDGVIVQNDAEPTIIPAGPEGGASDG